jgi:hypothetical protein
MKRWSRNRIGYIHYDYSGFVDFNLFKVNIFESLKEGLTYSLLLKVEFNDDRYCMVGRQVGFDYKDKNDLNDLVDLYKS